MEWRTWVPVASLVIGASSLLFSTIVLYPWHLELSDQFMEMKNSCDSRLRIEYSSDY